MGCVCDEGYEGYDCSSRKCPWGIDPTYTKTSSYEKFILRCKADYGHFPLLTSQLPILEHSTRG